MTNSENDSPQSRFISFDPDRSRILIAQSLRDAQTSVAVFNEMMEAYAEGANGPEMKQMADRLEKLRNEEKVTVMSWRAPELPDMLASPLEDEGKHHVFIFLNSEFHISALSDNPETMKSSTIRMNSVVQGAINIVDRFASEGKTFMTGDEVGILFLKLRRGSINLIQKDLPGTEPY